MRSMKETERNRPQRSIHVRGWTRAQRRKVEAFAKKRDWSLGHSVRYLAMAALEGRTA